MFDIDHLYLMSYNYNITDNDGKQEVTTEIIKEENQNKYYQNEIIDCLLTLLKDTENSINILFKSIDNDTSLITSVSDRVEEEGSTKDEPYNFGSLHELVIRKNDYITGKTGIGPFALNVTNQVLTYLYGIKFKESKFARETGILRLDNLLDLDSNTINSWLSGFINAHVDIVKDPYISRLNVNPYTYNMVNLLTRSGWGDLTLWFCAQPIIRDLANAANNAKSQFSRDPLKTKSAWQARENALKDAALKYLTEQEIDEDIISKYAVGSTKQDVEARISVVNWIKSNKKVLEQIVINPSAETIIVDGVEYNKNDVQKTVFYAWKTLEPKAAQLGNFVQHTKIDTRKHGKSLIAINKYLLEYNKIFHPLEESQWDMASLKDLEEGSWIGIKTKLAIKMPSAILGGQTFAANLNFLNAVLRIGSITSDDINTLNAISRSLLTAIKSQYFIDYTRNMLCKPGESVDDHITNLLVGLNSMNARLERLKNAIELNPKYSRLASNNLINQIYSVIPGKPILVDGKLVKKPAFITVLDNVDDSRINSDLLIDGWTDLLNDEDEFVRKFARDLIVYSFITSGEFKGWNKLFKYVPSQWLLGNIDTEYKSYSNFISDALQWSTEDYMSFVDDIVANNFMDYRFAKRVLYKDPDSNIPNFIDVNTIIRIGSPIAVDLTSPEYITTPIGNGYSAKDYMLYKLVGYIWTDAKQDESCPVYARIKKRGYHGTRGYDIYEYGWQFKYSENENSTFQDFDLDAALSRMDLIEIGKLRPDTSAKAIADVYMNRSTAEELNEKYNIHYDDQELNELSDAIEEQCK